MKILKVLDKNKSLKDDLGNDVASSKGNPSFHEDKGIPSKPTDLVDLNINKSCHQNEFTNLVNSLPIHNETSQPTHNEPNNNVDIKPTYTDTDSI